MTTESTPAGGTPNPAAAPSTPNTGAGAAPAGSDTMLGAGNAAPGNQADKGQAPGAQNPDAKGDQGNKPEVPEAYEFKMPDGMELDGKAAEEFTAIAKELKLSQADAQRIADVAVKMQQKQAETHVEMVKGWADQCKIDREFGGDNLHESLATARKAIDAFGSPELKALLNSSGLGNHPEVVRFAFKAGKAMSEDTFVQSGARTPTPEGTPLEKRLYPNMN